MLLEGINFYKASRVILHCLVKFINFSLQVNGFKTSIIICDGASSNLSMIKASHGCHGMYGVNPGKDPYKVKPWFVNPYDSLHHIFWLICPSHQVKHSIAFTLLNKFNFLAQEYD